MYISQASSNLDSPPTMRITMNNITSIDAKINIENIKTEGDDNERGEEGDEISDEDRELDGVKVEVDIDFNYVKREIIKTEPVEIDNETNNEIVVEKEIIGDDDDDINIKKEILSDEEDKLQEGLLVTRKNKRELNSALWKMRFLPHLDGLTRIARNKDTDQLITFQSPRSSEQKNITEAKRTGKNLTDITKLRICGACNKSLRSMRTANDANYTHVIKLNYKPPQRTNSDETTDSCDMCNRAFPRNTQKFYFKCAFCHFETNNKYRLNTHTNARHTKRIRYACVYCSFTTYVKVKLGSHVNVAHTECLTCRHCGYAAKFKSYLNKHVCAQHATTKVFSCNFCTYSSKQKGSLDKHFVDVHTETADS